MHKSLSINLSGDHHKLPLRIAVDNANANARSHLSWMRNIRKCTRPYAVSMSHSCTMLMKDSQQSPGPVCTSRSPLPREWGSGIPGGSSSSWLALRGSLRFLCEPVHDFQVGTDPSRTRKIASATHLGHSLLLTLAATLHKFNGASKHQLHSSEG